MSTVLIDNSIEQNNPKLKGVLFKDFAKQPRVNH